MSKRTSRLSWSGGALVVVASVLALVAYSPDAGDSPVHRVDFGAVQTSVQPSFQAEIEPAPEAPVKEFRIPITHETIEIADGVEYTGWTFGGTVPGPVIRVREGDRVRIELVNESPMPHSIDFHSARIPWNEAYKTIAPGEELEFEFTAGDPGAYLVHCGTPPVLMHIMQGMYMAMIVDPRDGWGSEVDREIVLMQSEFYASAGEGDGALKPDYRAAQAKQPRYVVFNGRAFQYRDHPIEVEVGERVRAFVVNAGPSIASDFHIVGAVFDRVYPDGRPENVLNGVQTWSVPAGGGAVFETVFERDASGEGLYPFVTHAFADAEKGAVGLIRVGSPEQVAGAAH